MNIVFMGTPDFATESLKELIIAGHNIVGVFTQPDKPVGRKHILTPPDVKVYAVENRLNVYQPDSMRTDSSYELLKGLNPDLCVVVAYGKILPRRILEIPKYGCINVHASLLPLYRGASPIQWSIVCGEKETGVSTMLLDEGMDTGDILLTEKTAIGENETAEELWDRLKLIGSKLLLKTVEGLEKGTIKPVKQDNDKATYAPIIKKTDAMIDWTKTPFEINCLIRGLHSWPVAYTKVGGKMLKIFDAEIIKDISAPCGKIITENNSLFICCKDGAIKINELQQEGSKRMMTVDFLRGKKFTEEFVDEV